MILDVLRTQKEPFNGTQKINNFFFETNLGNIRKGFSRTKKTIANLYKCLRRCEGVRMR